MAELKVLESSKGYYQLQGDLNRNTIAHSDALATIEQSSRTNNAQGNIMTIDMATVTHADTAGLAWLMNLLKDCRQQNKQCELKNIPASLIKLAKISDVDSFLSVQ